ncbi:tryptophan-rich antigen [Plasmodium ovale wallikeri]|uniref:Tryptophan-rich antigen n=1 Tax=Plasmodium ovale wallikeri TaxID=864142 RepID=A0A1A8YLN9_PLAOA|nr:tryptophan-rich antigen [Plasmodium ovale wallikeri]SBT32486.1 tryptophan-rich antigen [Plasmodium ovale wallikeri]
MQNMESRKNIQDNPSIKFSATTSRKNRNHVFPNIKSTSFVSRLSITLIALSCAFLFNYVSAVSTNGPNSPISYTLIGINELNLEQSEEFKKMAWNNWMMRLESDWKHFLMSIEKEKTEWIEEKDVAWSEWMKNMQHRWTQYNEPMHLEYNTNILEKSAQWNDSQWNAWMKKEGKEIMDAQWAKWVYECNRELDQMVWNKWVQWKNDKIRSWLSNEWKAEEDYYWSNWECSTKAKWLHLAERRHWLKWKERVSREAEQWINWIQMKERVYINDEWMKWNKWKSDKQTLFNKWETSFIYKWTMKKQWNVWIREANNMKSVPQGNRVQSNK